MNNKNRKQKIGIALGSGSARGFAHVGILQALLELGIEPDIVAGTSVGAIVGSFYAAGKLKDYADWSSSLTRKTAMKLMDFNWIPKGGVVEGEKLLDVFKQHIGDQEIEDLPKKFAAIATDLVSGQEIWLQEGSLLSAIRASMALPGLLSPHHYQNRWMVDGGLVNPVPVSACRAMGADTVIAVDLNRHLLGRRFADREDDVTESKKSEEDLSPFEKIKRSLFGEKSNDPEAEEKLMKPGLVDVTLSAINIMQDRITRSRMAGDPPDLILAPRLSHIGLLDFDNVAEAIEEGRSAVKTAEFSLKELFPQTKAKDTK